MGTDPLFLWSSKHGSLNGPVFKGSFAYPKGAFDSLGIYHLLWGEGNVPVPPSDNRVWPRDWPLVITRLYHASYDGKGWTTPELVLESKTINWSQDNGQGFGSDAFHLVVTKVGQSGKTELVHFVRNSDGWRSRVIGYGAYATITGGMSSGSLVVVFTGGDPVLRRSRDALLTVRSSDDGQTWSAPVRVGGANWGEARTPILGNDFEGIALTWLGNPSDSAGESIGFARSDDDGKTWRLISESPRTEGQVLDLEIGSVGRSTVAVVETLTNGRIRLFESTSRNASLAPLFLEVPFAGFTAVTSDGTAISIYFTGVGRNGGKRELLIATKQAC